MGLVPSKRRGEFKIMGLYNRFCSNKRFFATVIVRTTAQADSRALMLYGYVHHSSSHDTNV